jgi:jumonji domain-containing protein 2
MKPSVYGADMEGSLFDGAEACGWNVNQLESCLALLEADYKDEGDLSETFKLPGVTSAYLYFGMWASVFSAHTEDMNLLSINYLHAGAPKYWYAIAQEDSLRFESLMKSTFSHQAIACKEFLRHKRSLLSPSLLNKAGISYTTQVQRAGDIIITFPGSYHFGFNTGFNCAESTNFAVPEWVPYGEKARICMCHPHSVRIDMRRFKVLLEQYENDILSSKGQKLSYSQWAKEFIRKKMKRSNANTCDLNSEKETVGKLKPFIVEVMKLSRYHRDLGSKAAGSSRKLKGKGKKMIEMEEYHFAMPMKVSNMKPQTQVLCLLDTDNDVECYFAGVIVDVVEQHAKIHFAGSTRDEDVWLTIDSGKLFLDGGITSDSPS